MTRPSTGPPAGGSPTDGPCAGIPALEDLGNLAGARVLVRVDFNVPLDTVAGGAPEVADDFRMRAAVPTLRWLLDRGAQVTACSHLGRPADAPDRRWEMGPVRRRLTELCPGISLSENLRFSPGERANDPAFVDALVDGHDAYVTGAFGVSHRAHASVVGPPSRLPSAAGRQFLAEVEVLGGLLDHPARPFVAVVGGAKVSDKLGVLRSLATKVDVLAVGGAMAFTFLRAAGHEVGASLVDDDHLDDCRALLGSPARILLPVDVVALEPGGSFGPAPSGPAASDPARRGKSKVVGADVPEGWMGLDVGPQTAAAFGEAVASAGTVLWNGPLGVVEDERFAAGTSAVAQAVSSCAGFTVVGGGDSVSAIRHLGLADRIDFLSTGGGASLAYMEHGDLPGIAALRAGTGVPVPAGGTRRA